MIKFPTLEKCEHKNNFIQISSLISTRVARAALGIPADIALTRPGMSVPDDLDQLELVASPALEETR